MAHETKMIAFGPVPSRRLGQSLGINNIPPKDLHLFLYLLSTREIPTHAD